MNPDGLSYMQVQLHDPIVPEAGYVNVFVHFLDGYLRLHPVAPGFVHLLEVAEHVYVGVEGTGFAPPIPT